MERRDQGGSPLARVLSSGASALGQLRRLGFWRWLRMEREELILAAKLTGTCVVGWWLAAYVLKLELPVLVPIGVLLTISATAYSTVVRGAQQVAAILAGLGAASALTWLIGANAVALAVLVVTGLVLSRLLKLPPQNVQIPITALLVFALGKTYGFARLADVLLGAALGIAANLLVLPPRFLQRAVKELCELSGELSDLAADMSAGLKDSWDEPKAGDWLVRARRLSGRVEDVEATADQAEESIRLAPRRRRYDRRVRQVAAAATCLGHACQQLRGVARGLADVKAGVRGLPAGSALPPTLADEMEALSRAFRAFGRLQAGGGAGEDLNDLRAALRGAEQERMAREFDAMEPGELRVLYGFLLEECARIRQEFDPDDGPHQDVFPRG
ncbi:hypothetical protein FH608_042370 [Nonomuraea phyllanthi]|uniref:Integral membrane bound transporter domain-containing protein n=1 Tax=Nonomuraea phyllanthi TaxID=2219224 RepID=A0A5C4VG11_9ACTN|nr:FUSC family protein [Nonomuraea phyllanthi]KAB8188733.1 hypothetical protein FH608_042370 [Nonomuraea phyllanthi]